MKELIKRSGYFIRNNPTIISSLLLIFVVIGALFLNSYVTLSRFQENMDKTLKTKALLAENVFSIVASDFFPDLSSNAVQLQSKITEIQKNNSEISQITIFAVDAETDGFAPIASAGDETFQADQQADTSKGQVEKNAKKFALSMNKAFAYISNSDGNRFWNVVKAVRGEDGAVQGILFLKLSLAENDALAEKTIMQVYLFSIGAMVLVLLLVFNHIRLFAFEVKAKKLEEVDRMKDDFISMASHDLRNPLTAISGYSGLLSDLLTEDKSGADHAEQKEYLNNINILTERLKNLVEDLLDVSRIQQNRMPINCVRTDISEIVSGIVQELQITADRKKLLLRNSLTNISFVMADPERTKQIVANLIGNAIKYTPSGTVDIQTKEDRGFVLVTVADTGIGMSSGDMKNLFSKFYRVQTSKTKEIVGTGLGLWISREMARKMGGDIEVESIEGVGSHFILKLRKA